MRWDRKRVMVALRESVQKYCGGGRELGKMRGAGGQKSFPLHEGGVKKFRHPKLQIPSHPHQSVSEHSLRADHAVCKGFKDFKRSNEGCLGEIIVIISSILF